MTTKQNNNVLSSFTCKYHHIFLTCKCLLYNYKQLVIDDRMFIYKFMILNSTCLSKTCTIQLLDQMSIILL